MSAEAAICAVCAWRGTCQKKFSLSGKNIRCPDFVQDVSLKKKCDNEQNKEEGEK